MTDLEITTLRAAVSVAAQHPHRVASASQIAAWLGNLLGNAKAPRVIDGALSRLARHGLLTAAGNGPNGERLWSVPPGVTLAIIEALRPEAAP